MNITRAKFRCNSITDHGTAKDVEMAAVYSQDPNSENKKFWDATPNGILKLTWVNPNVNFQPGKEYYLDITLSE